MADVCKNLVREKFFQNLPPFHRIVAVVLMKKADLSSVDAAAGIDHVKIRPDPGVHRIAAGNVGAGHRRTVGDDDFCISDAFHLCILPCLYS